MRNKEIKKKGVCALLVVCHERTENAQGCPARLASLGQCLPLQTVSRAHACSHQPCLACGRFHAAAAELSSPNRDPRSPTPKVFAIWGFAEKFADPRF